MAAIIEALLRLENLKNQALIDANAPSYDEHVRAQLHLFDSLADFKIAAQGSPEKLQDLAGLIRANSALLANLLSISPVFRVNHCAYTSDGQVDASPGRRIEVEG